MSPYLMLEAFHWISSDWNYVWSLNHVSSSLHHTRNTVTTAAWNAVTSTNAVTTGNWYFSFTIRRVLHYPVQIINSLSNVLITVSVCRHFLKCFDLKEWARSNVTRKAALFFTWFVLPINFIPNSNWLHTQNKNDCKVYILSWQIN